MPGESEILVFKMTDFSLKEKVGRGNNSDVRLLERVADNKKFAGKMLKDASCNAFLNEAKIINSLTESCVNIVNLVGIITNPQCLVLQFYKNGDLGTALSK